jgi:hypothetical protein
MEKKRNQKNKEYKWKKNKWEGNFYLWWDEANLNERKEKMEGEDKKFIVVYNITHITLLETPWLEPSDDMLVGFFGRRGRCTRRSKRVGDSHPLANASSNILYLLKHQNAP